MANKGSKSVSFIERLSIALSLLSVSLVVAGTKACQEDYDLGSQASVDRTQTATPTATDDDDDGDDDIATRTPTPEPTTPGEETVEPTPTEETSSILSTSSASSILTELSLLATISPSEENAGPGSEAATTKARGKNWLGENFKDGGSGSEDQIDNTDSDGDGYSDWLESKFNSSPNYPASIPQMSTSTRLYERLKGIDDDKDGLSNEEEIELGSDPQSSDTNGDGKLDGAQVVSGGNPKEVASYLDSDGDGLSDAFEESRSINPTVIDSDSDRLNDELEVAIGSDPNNPDSDSDGISDGQEFQVGSDPTRPESWVGKK